MGSSTCILSRNNFLSYYVLDHLSNQLWKVGSQTNTTYRIDLAVCSLVADILADSEAGIVVDWEAGIPADLVVDNFVD